MSDIEDILIEHSWKDFDICFDAKRDLDNKTNMILVANGVLVGLLINSLASLNIFFSASSMVFILLSSYFCVKGISLRSYSISNSMEMWRALRNRNLLEGGENITIEAKKNIFSTINLATERNWKVYEDITENFKKANVTFFIALLIIGIALITMALSSLWVHLFLQNATILH